MDFSIEDGQITNMTYKQLPVISDWLEADGEMEAYINQMRQGRYDENIIEARNKKWQNNPIRVGKTFEEILQEKLAKADRTLYRRGNFMGTWDQVICNALRWEYKADIALSAGVRWGTTTLEGEWITMEDVMSQCATTYSETYVQEMTGKAIKEMLEGVADNLFDPDPYLQSGGDMVRVGGLDYTIDPTKPLGQRISEVRLDNGEVIADDKNYSVSGWATVNRTPEGRLLWDIIADYLKAERGEDMVIKLPKVNNPKVVGVSDNPGFADYPGEWA
jgi:sulfur-oxidizing protein SoxB